MSTPNAILDDKILFLAADEHSDDLAIVFMLQASDTTSASSDPQTVTTIAENTVHSESDPISQDDSDDGYDYYRSDREEHDGIDTTASAFYAATRDYSSDSETERRFLNSFENPSLDSNGANVQSIAYMCTPSPPRNQEMQNRNQPHVGAQSVPVQLQLD